MRKVIGICNLHNEPSLGGLTEKRPLGAVTFLGRYGLIDFTLSNFSNSHIERVYVLIRNGIVALRRHVGSGAIWTNNTKLGFIELLLNENNIALISGDSNAKRVSSVMTCLEECHFASCHHTFITWFNHFKIKYNVIEFMN